MKNLTLTILVLLPLSLIGQTDEANLLSNIWLNEKKEAKVQFYKKDGKYYGDVIWLAEKLNDHIQPLRDLKNPNTELRSRPIMNMPLIEDMCYKGDEWCDGTAYNPRSGRYFKCRMWFDDTDILKIRGYWGFLFGTETWTKTTDQVTSE